jgi:hypothetical protein
MAVPFVINMHPHPTVKGNYHSLPTSYKVTRAGQFVAEFDDPDLAQMFVNAMTYIEEVKVCGHLDAYPACEYLLRNTITKGIPP